MILEAQKVDLYINYILYTGRWYCTSAITISLCCQCCNLGLLLPLRVHRSLLLSKLLSLPLAVNLTVSVVTPVAADAAFDGAFDIAILMTMTAV